MEKIFSAPLLLLICCVYASPAYACTIVSPPATIIVQHYSARPIIDHTLGRDELKKRSKDLTASPYGDGPNVHVNGQANSHFNFKTSVYFNQSSSSGGNRNCFSYKHIGLIIIMNPVINIAREIPEGSCLYNEVLKHEYKHFNVDYASAKDFQAILQLELSELARKTGVLGPYSLKMVEKGPETLSKNLSDKLDASIKRLMEGRNARQKKIDTLEEYERVPKVCPNSEGIL